MSVQKNLLAVIYIHPAKSKFSPSGMSTVHKSFSCSLSKNFLGLSRHQILKTHFLHQTLRASNIYTACSKLKITAFKLDAMAHFHKTFCQNMSTLSKVEYTVQQLNTSSLPLQKLDTKTQTRCINNNTRLRHRV